MNLKIKERILFSVFYPQKGDLETQILVRDIKGKVGLKQKDLEEVNFKTQKNGQTFTWDEKKDVGIEFTFTSREIDLLKDQIDKLDKEKSITLELLDLCLKIKESK